MISTIERLDDALDQVETLVIELGLPKAQTVEVCEQIEQLWRTAKQLVEENTNE